MSMHVYIDQCLELGTQCIIYGININICRRAIYLVLNFSQRRLKSPACIWNVQYLPQWHNNIDALTALTEQQRHNSMHAVTRRYSGHRGYSNQFPRRISTDLVGNQDPVHAVLLITSMLSCQSCHYIYAVLSLLFCHCIYAVMSMLSLQSCRAIRFSLVMFRSATHEVDNTQRKKDMQNCKLCTISTRFYMFSLQKK